MHQRRQMPIGLPNSPTRSRLVMVTGYLLMEGAPTTYHAKERVLQTVYVWQYS